MNNRFRFLIGLGVSGVALYVVLRELDFVVLRDILTRATYLYLLPAASISILTLWLRAVRWQYLLQPIGKIGRPRLFSSIMIGYLGNNILPARAGDIIRAYVLGTRENLSSSAVFATIVVEKILDGYILLSFLTVGLALISFPGWAKRMVLPITLFFLLVSLILILLIQGAGALLGMVKLALGVVPDPISKAVMVLLEKFVEGLQVIRKPTPVLVCLALTLMIWVLEAASVLCFLAALHIEVSWMAAALVEIAVAFGTMMPAAPGYVGTYQFLSMRVLALFGIEADYALGFSILMHATLYVLTTGLGLWCWWGESLSLGEISAAADTVTG